MTDEERDVLAAWSSWGAVPALFDPVREDWAEERAELRRRLTGAEYDAARRTTINAHYTAPAYATSMWKALEDLGLPAGARVLEPGCGSGNFLGVAPDRIQATGVELDPISARIAQVLYPDAEIRIESFADTPHPDGAFDAVIGNVPFGDIKLHDPRHNRSRLAMHNHFIVKSLHMTRPGGIVAVLTSSFTLDSQNPAARREMHQLADLVTAVRLPTDAHRRTAGTSVVTDLLVLRRRDTDAPVPDDPGWLTTAPVQLLDERSQEQLTRINQHFLAHPERVLGQMSLGSGMYGAATLRVRSDDLTDVPAQLERVLSAVTAAAGPAHRFTERQTDTAPASPVAFAPSRDSWLGTITQHPDTSFTVLTRNGEEPLTVPRTQIAELALLLRLRDGAGELLTAEAASSEDTPAIERLRTDLRNRYRYYKRSWGPINRARIVTLSRVDPETGQPATQRRVPPAIRLLSQDPFGPLVKALEIYDDVSGEATEAALLSERVVQPPVQVRGADTAADALAVCLDKVGRVDLDEIAALRGLTPAEARTELGTLVFDDPERGLVTAAEYLSGNVRAKLDSARIAAVERPELQVNVDALAEVQPPDLGPDEIEPQIGAAWISADDHRQFLVDLLGDRNVQVLHAGGNMWAVDAPKWSVAATSEWGTEEWPTGNLMHALLEQRTVQVWDTHMDGRRTLNLTETEAAREKATALQERFAEWAWEDPDRANRLTAEYNRVFNNLRLRDYSAEGAALTLPGMVRTFNPRPHQRAAVARMIAEPAVGLFHQVGAGKTAEMVMGVMELRRLGMVNKPVVAVPNHMLEQFSREWLQMYPGARVLAASSEDLAGDKRRDFVARAATNSWDAVIMTHSSFERLPVPAEVEADYIGRELNSMREMKENMAAAGGAAGRSLVKRLEKTILRAEEDLKAKLDKPVDPGLTFTAAGIDYVVVDEAHLYKNLRTPSAIADAAIAGSKRASDLHMKAELLRRRGGRVMTMATATPIANSITEAHVMQRYLRPDLLEQAGVLDFDAWANTFGRTVTEMEMGPAGGFRQKTRFAKFQNVPEMLRMWAVFADVKTAQDLNLPTPDLRARPDGQRLPEMVVIPPTREVLAYVADLGQRAEDIAARRVDPSEDNMLKVSTDGRKAALDLRLVDPGHVPDSGSKLEVAADRIAAIHHAHADRRYTDPATGEPHPTPGALQIVFCDLSTPSERWNAYDELRGLLVDRGVPSDGIRFIHDAKNDRDKGRLFAAARSGHVAVLVGSTQKMGVGTNVQARAVALHHLDCPWRPADLEQRDGRIMRQGNQNPQIEIIRYAVERSFDGYSWQTVERKGRFIEQVMRGRLDVREIEDIGDSTLSFAEAKALASGDPLVLEKAQADNDLARLQRLHRAHQRNEHALRARIRQSESYIDASTTDADLITAAIARRRPTAGDAFAAEISGERHIDRPAAAAALLQLIHRHRAESRIDRPRDYGVVAALGGHRISARQELRRDTPELRLRIADVPHTDWTVRFEELNGQGLLRQCENRIAGLDRELAHLRAGSESARASIDAAQTQLARPFKHAQALEIARERSRQITQAMQGSTQPASEPDDPADQALGHYPIEYGPEPPAVVHRSVPDASAHITR